MTPAAEPTPAAASPADGPAEVHLDTDRDVAVLTLDHPAKLDALTRQMTTALGGTRRPPQRRPRRPGGAWSPAPGARSARARDIAELRWLSRTRGAVRGAYIQP